jgi:hypothetical protein
MRIYGEGDYPGLSDTALNDLAGSLERQGHRARVGIPGDGRPAWLQEGAWAATVDVLTVVLDESERGLVDAAALLAVASTLTRWARRHRLRRVDRGPSPSATIWGPNGEPLKKVDLLDRDGGKDRAS